MTELEQCKKTKNELIVKLWNTFRKMAEIRNSDNFTDEDLDIFMHITQHSSIQDKLKGMK